MSRRIAYLFATAGCLTFIAPAGADPECFDGVCRMPEVMELPLSAAPRCRRSLTMNAGVGARCVQPASEQPRWARTRAGPSADAGRRSAAPGAPALVAAPGGEGVDGGNAAGVQEKPRHRRRRSRCRHAPHPVIEEPISAE